MIEYEIINNVGKITFNRPEKFHSINTEFANILIEHIKDCATNNEIKSILITAKGKAFCAGQDLGEFNDPTKIDFEKVLDSNYHPIIQSIRNIEKPVIAAVNGVAAGAGASIALCCDIIIASENATFTQAFSKIGLIPDSASTFFLPRTIGLHKAAGLMMTGDIISAKEALNIGMVYKVYNPKDFEIKSLDFASKLSQMPSQSIKRIKKLLNQSFKNNLESQLNLEKKYQIECGKTQDFKEGIKAFIEKRKPKFTGN